MGYLGLALCLDQTGFPSRLNNGREERCGSPPEHWSVSVGVGIENSFGVGVGGRNDGKGLWMIGLLDVDELAVIIFVDSPVRDFVFHFFFLSFQLFFLFLSRDIMNIIILYYFDWG